MGFEPMIRVLQTLALATWPRRRAYRILSKSRGMVKRNNRVMGLHSVREPIIRKTLFRGFLSGRWDYSPR